MQLTGMLKTGALIWLCTFSLIFIYLIPSLDEQTIQNDILRLLPAEEEINWLAPINKNLSQRIQSDIIVIVEGRNRHFVQQAVESIHLIVDSSNDFELVKTKDTIRLFQSLYPYRYQLMSDDYQTLIASGDTSLVTKNTLSVLYSPFSMTTAEELKTDPWLIFRNYLQNTVPGSPFKLENNQLISHQSDMHQALISIKVMQSAYLPAVAKRIRQLDEQFNRLQHSVTIWRFGLPVVAAEAVTAAYTEMTYIGGGSLLVILLIVYKVFRQGLPIILAIAAIGTGVVIACAALVMVFGYIHTFVLVLGISLMGIIIDYVFHYLCHWSQTDQSKIYAITKTTLLGLLTTLFAYTAFLYTDLMILQQFAVFSMAGLIGAGLTIILCFPFLLLSTSPEPDQRLSRCLVNIAHSPYLKWSGLILLLLPGLFFLTLNDDVRLLHTVSDQNRLHEQRIYELTQQSSSASYIVIIGNTEQALAENEHAFEQQLAEWVQTGQIADYFTLSQLIPYPSEQMQSYKLASQLSALEQTDLAQYLDLADFDLPPYKTLTLSDPNVQLLLTALNVDLLRGQVNGLYYSIVLYDALVDNLSIPEQFEQVYLIDQANRLSETFKNLRQEIAVILVLAYSLVFGWLTLKWSLKTACRLTGASLISSALVLACLGWLGVSLNLFHVFGLVLLLGIGIDYSIFYHRHGQTQATLTAVFLSGLTTLSTFGIMSFSVNLAVASFGLAISIGIFGCWILALLFNQPVVNHEAST